MHKEIEEIRKKRLNSPWPQYLRSLSIAGLRGWKGQEVRFDFPVVVVAGENGSGKSTVLKAAAAAYAHATESWRAYYPGIFFPDTAWEQSKDVTLTFKTTEGSKERSYSARKPTTRWRLPERAKRNVVFQDVSRTLPLDAVAGYARIAKRTATETAVQILTSELIQYYSAILGRKYDDARLAYSSLDPKRRVGVVRTNGEQFSQFHQGAGEDATLDLLSLLQNVPDYSLIIVDEVEASLHPRSQRRLIHFLLWLARTKQIQVILSTHSSYVLEELPPEARILLSRDAGDLNVFYGPTPNYALSRMDDIDRPDLYIFTEDNRSSEAAAEILREEGVTLSRIRFMEVGPSNMVQALGRLAHEDRLPARGIGLLDADVKASVGCVLLPGTALAPEKQLFADLQQYALPTLAQRLGVSEASLRDALERSSTLGDHHVWPNELAKRLNQTPEYVWTTMCQVWARVALTKDQRAPLRNVVNTALA